MVQNAYVTLTPAECRNPQKTAADRDVLSRLQDELLAGVYAGPQYGVVRSLVAAWTADDQDLSWTTYIWSADAKRRCSLLGAKRPDDKLNDFDFWVRALSLTAAFANEKYVRLLREGLPMTALNVAEAA